MEKGQQTCAKAARSAGTGDFADIQSEVALDDPGVMSKGRV